MVANLAYINGEVAMAYQDETPWHQLGTKQDMPTVKVALETANLDWLVNADPVFVKQGDVYVPVNERRALVRDVDNMVLGIVSEDYAPLQNHEAFGVLDTACKEFGVTIASAGALGPRGDRAWMQAKLPDSIEPIKGDKIDGYFLIVTGHNGGTPYTARPTPIRVVCENTLNMAVNQSDALIKLNHVRADIDNIDLVAQLINDLVYALKVSGDTFAELAAKKWDLPQVRQYIDAVVGIASHNEVEAVIAQYLEADVAPDSAKVKQRDQIMSLVWNGKGARQAGAVKSKQTATAWAAYNAVTEWVDHVRPAEVSEKMRMKANTSALFGAANNMKERALELAIAA